MTDDKAEDIAGATEGDEQGLHHVGPRAGDASPATDERRLSDLMAQAADAGGGVADAQAETKDRAALAAAEQALTDGSAAVIEAEQALAQTHLFAARRGARNELILRALLAVNLVAMIVVVLVPDPVSSQVTVGDDAAAPSAAPTSSEPWSRALYASEQRDWSTAVTILEEYLSDRDGLVPSERLSVLSALSYYASQGRDLASSRRYAQQAQALKQSHPLIDDLVTEAEVALASGDEAALRKILARLVLRRDEVPSHIHPYLVESYLELGDSFREDSAAGANADLMPEMKAAAARLRAEALEREEKR